MDKPSKPESHDEVDSEDLLAEGSVASVEGCDCGGHMHIHVGNLTLHMENHEVESLWATLGQAIAKMREQKGKAEVETVFWGRRGEA